jgi:hypothetical protein
MVRHNFKAIILELVYRPIRKKTYSVGALDSAIHKAWTMILCFTPEDNSLRQKVENTWQFF